MAPDKHEPGVTNNIPKLQDHHDAADTARAVWNKVVPDSHSYVTAGRIMVLVVLISAILLLILVIAYIAVRHRNRRRRLQSSWRQHQLFFSNRAEPSPRRLDQGIVNSIPVIELSLHGDDTTESCAVCISEFAHGDKVRVLPQCHHQFHLACIDMWFGSHSTCPLCRCDINLTTKLEFVELEETQNKEVDTVHEQGSGDCLEHQSPLDHIV